ncbi:MAG: hypothetical protein N2050_06560 [Flavobacteriales bacterium]|nr:hypothetical protein [Flavobacteriales bacterium]MCX7650199.1 hypothetical protein [Flavobacteriales bacterium]MDW8432275.1 hypothetical protein [Flavobacteriales bacterium]
MRYFIKFLICVFVLASSKAQSLEDFNLRPGAKLHFKINNSTNFLVELLELGDQVRFVWYKNGVRGFDITFTPEAVQNAVQQLNHIYGMVGMPPQKYDQATSVFFSRKLFKDLLSRNDITFYPYPEGLEKPEKIRLVSDTTWMTKKIQVKDEKTRKYYRNLDVDYLMLPAYVCRLSNGNRWVVLDAEKFPLILYMKLDFEIRLEGIE